MVSKRILEIAGRGNGVGSPVRALGGSPCSGVGVAVLVWLLALGWTTSSWALTVVPRTFAELVGLADWVVIGTVTQTASAVEGERIYTYITLADLEVIKGAWHDAEYRLRISGGVVGERAEVYQGLPQLDAGRRYLLFIQGNFSTIFPVVGLHQGVFRVQWDPARQQTVVLPLTHQEPPRTSDVSALRQSQLSVFPEAGIPVEAFVERIHAQLRALSQDSSDAVHRDHPEGLPVPGGSLP